MRRDKLVVVLAAGMALLLRSGVVRAQTNVCPSSKPQCLSGVSADFSGTFVCTLVGQNVSGQVSNQVVVLISKGDGTFTGSLAQNNNSSNTPTYQDFQALAAGGTYCVNADDTGYLFPTNAGSCPFAMVIDNGKTETRVIDTTGTNAAAGVCTKQ